MSERLTGANLQEIEDYLASGGAGGDERVETWLRSLVAEVRRFREAAPQREEVPRKMHGDALLDGSGTRHGEHEVR